jgi:sugar lactone lactonase YvrE
MDRRLFFVWVIISAFAATSSQAAGQISTAAAAESKWKTEFLLEPRPLPTTVGATLRGDEFIVTQPAIDAVSGVDVNTGAITTIASEDDPDSEELITPDGIWRDPDTDDLYVVEYLKNSVTRISTGPDGQPTRTPVLVGFGDGTAHPVGITGLRSDDSLEKPLRLFITMIDEGRQTQEPMDETGIWEIDPAGLVPPRLVYGAAGGQVVFGHGLRGPKFIAFDPEGKELFVPEVFTGKVWAIDVDKKYVNEKARLVYEPRSSKEMMNAVDFDRDGKLLAVEWHPGRVLRLDPRGPANQIPEVVAQLEPGLEDLEVHPDGRILISRAHGGVAVVHPNGRAVDLLPRSLNIPQGLTLLADGRVAIGDFVTLTLFDPKKKTLTRPWQALREGFDLGATSVGTTGECDAYVTGFSRGTLQYVDVCKPDQSAKDVLSIGTFLTPADVAVSSPTELWVSDTSGFVWNVRVNGAEPATASRLTATFVGPTGLALGPKGLYVAESDADQVRIVDPRTGKTLDVITNLDEPEGLAFEEDGSLLVVEAGLGRLTRVGADGSRESVVEGLKTKVRGVGAIPTVNWFADVMVTEAGEIWITSPQDGSLMRLVHRP